MIMPGAGSTVPLMTAPMRDFTRIREAITFRIDDDVFAAAPAIPGDLLTEFATRYADVGNAPVAQQVGIMKDALGLVLLPESHARFTKRLSDVSNPIELEQVVEVVQWLMERYGKRPTQPSLPLPDGQESPEPGMSWTDEQQPPGSTPEPFQPSAG